LLVGIKPFIGKKFYTGNGSPVFSGQMSFLRSRSITKRSVLLVLVAGFSLVILVLLAASAVSFRNTRFIQESVSRLVREQLVISKLINEVQAQQATLNEVYYELVQGVESLDRPTLTRQLQDSNEALSRILSVSAGTPEGQVGRNLSALASRFSEQSAALMAQKQVTADDIEPLLATHEQVIPLVAKLVSASSERAMTLESDISRQSRRLFTESFALLALALTLAFLCAVFTVKLTGGLFRRMQTQEGELSRVSWHMLESQEAAARRFSHELHDELGQSLTAIKANLSAMSGEEVSRRRLDCIQLVDEAILNVRELSQLLRPVILDDFGLDAGLRWLAERFSQRTGVGVDYHSSFPGRLADEAETHLFRIAQEALTNVARHSQASRVHIDLTRENEGVRMTIGDNGRGLTATSGGHGLGLVGMRARAQHAGGDVKITSKAGAGTTISIWMPATVVMGDEQEDPHPVGRRSYGS
jgi:signal transduction histidine kinase